MSLSQASNLDLMKGHDRLVDLSSAELGVPADDVIRSHALPG
jgi:hypothetical protein